MGYQLSSEDMTKRQRQKVFFDFNFQAIKYLTPVDG